MEDPIYRDIILDHFKNPSNYGLLEDPDFKTTDYNPLCGDEISITGKVKNGKLASVKFESRGCAISKASASIMTEKFLKKNINKINLMKPEEYLQILEIELSPSRIKCALLGFSSLKKALNDFTSSS
ncbi:MAG TPA: iron-sulfur cluster assembly scaffold protein [Patescibacteria group bacterium]|nr:iron-sulfur cluster assembly scaffold protein [Patescibacteria group bacterium]